MTLAGQQVFISRVKSLGWRALGVGLVAALTWLAENVGLLEWHSITFGTMVIDPNPYLVTGLGLVVGEVTKYFNVNKNWLKTQIN